MVQTFEWLSWPLPTKLAEILGRDNIRFVGGAVRDSLIGLPINDIDAATPLLPEIVNEKLTAAGISVIPTGLKHGTVTAHEGGVSIEITTLRVDADTDGRHATVEYTDDWEVDASRRDFTFNALYVDRDGKLFDPFDGVHDLNAGLVRFIGDPKKRIEEDYLRILRFFRFYARYGKGDIHVDGLNACVAARDKLVTLSVERIREEFLKLSLAKNALEVVDVMERHQIIVGCYPHASRSVEYLKAVVSREISLGIDANQLARFAAIFGFRGDVEPTFASYFKLPNKHQSLFRASGGVAKMLSESQDQDSLKRMLKVAIYKFGLAAVTMSLLLIEKDYTFLIKDWHAFKNWDVPVFPVRGRDLIDEGFEPGPNMAETLKSLETYWLANNFTPTRMHLLQRVNKL